MPQLSRLKKSASKFLSLVFHRPKAKITRGTVIVAVTMPMILILALMMRLYPLMQSQPIPRAFDPWFQLKLVEYVAQHGYVAFFSWYDDTSWVPFGRQIAERAYLGVPFTGAFVYYLANALGIEVSITYVALVFPAIMGAITVLLSFFLGRETSNNTVGMLTALFMAVLPAYMQRSIAGFFDNESLGVFAIVLALWLFVRSLKRNSTLSAVGAGLAIAYLNASWGAADFLVSLFALYAFLMILFGRYSQRLLSTYTITIALGLFIGNLVPRNGFSDISSVSFMVPVGIGVLLVGYEIWIRMAGQRAAAMDAFGSYLRPILFGAITSAIGVVGYFVYTGNIGLQIATLESTPFLTIGGKFLTVVNPFFRMEQRIFASVAEHLPSPWSSFYSNLSVLVLFMPLGMYFLFKRRRDEDILLVLYGISSVYFTGSMIRLALILSVGAAVLGAVAVNGVLAPFARIVVQKSVFERRRFRVSSALTTKHICCCIQC
ncbi:MAG: STT3 domain-containing protein [Candidatus Thorarchaeota archaeon]